MHDLLDFCGCPVASSLFFGIFRLRERLMFRQILFWIFVIGLLVSLVPVSLEACPACKELDEPSARGFNWSVLFMMAMPFTVFGIIGGSVFYHYRALKT